MAFQFDDEELKNYPNLLFLTKYFGLCCDLYHYKMDSDRKLLRGCCGGTHLHDDLCFEFEGSSMEEILAKAEAGLAQRAAKLRAHCEANAERHFKDG